MKCGVQHGRKPKAKRQASGEGAFRNARSRIHSARSVHRRKRALFGRRAVRCEKMAPTYGHQGKRCDVGLGGIAVVSLAQAGMKPHACVASHAKMVILWQSGATSRRLYRRLKSRRAAFTNPIRKRSETPSTKRKGSIASLNTSFPSSAIAAWIRSNQLTY